MPLLQHFTFIKSNAWNIIQSALIFTLSVSYTHSQDQASTETTTSLDQQVNIMLVGDLSGQSLNPILNADPLVDTIVYENVFQGLTYITSSGAIEMLLADRIAISKDQFVIEKL